MRREDIEFFVGKKVKLNCHTEQINLYYTGTVLKITTDSLHLSDKFGKLVIISLDSIKSIVEV